MSLKLLLCLGTRIVLSLGAFALLASQKRHALGKVASINLRILGGKAYVPTGFQVHLSDNT